MNGSSVETLIASGSIVRIVYGPLSGIRAKLIKVTDDGKAILRLDGLEDIFVAVPIEQIVLAPNT